VSPMHNISNQIRLSEHAVSRYQMRLRPTLSPAAARVDLERLLAVGTFTTRTPEWVKLAETTRSYLLLSDAAALPLRPLEGGGWVATTCMVRESLSPARHAARKKRRNDKTSSQRARRRSGSSTRRDRCK